MLKGVLGFTIKTNVNLFSIFLPLNFTVDLFELFRIFQIHIFFTNLGDVKEIWIYRKVRNRCNDWPFLLVWIFND